MKKGEKNHEVKDGSLDSKLRLFGIDVGGGGWKDEFKNTRARIRETIKSRGVPRPEGGRHISGEFVNDAVALTNGPVQQRPIRPREKSDGVRARARARVGGA